MGMRRGQGLFRIVAILPVVLSPAVVGMVWRTFMLAPEFGVVDYLAITAGLGSRNWLGDPTLALVSVVVIHTWQWTPFAFMVLLASLAALPDDLYEAARIDRANAWQRFIRITLPLIRPAIVMVVIMRTMVALTAFAAIFTVTGGGPGTATEILNLYAYRKSFTELSIGYGSTLAVALLILTVADLRRALRDQEGAMSRKRFRLAVMVAISLVFLLAWVFPIVWSVLNSLKTERDILAYPPKLVFTPTLEAYRDVLFGSSSILPNLWSSFVISIGTTVITMLLAVPAAYALARLRVPGKRFAGFYILATQMLPPVGIIIPYFLILRNIGWMDTYQGIILIYLSFSLPFAIWLLVSYFEDIPLEMEEAAYLDGASRLRTLWRIIIPQVQGGIAVTVVFVFLNAWNEFLFAVVLERQHGPAGHDRDVQLRLRRADPVGEARRRLGPGDAAGDRPRRRRAEAHRQGAHGRRREGRRAPVSMRGQVHFERIVKMHGAVGRPEGHRPRDRAGRVLRAARSVRLGQEHDASHPRRPRHADLGPRLRRRPGRHRASTRAIATSPWCSRATRSTRT